MRMLFVKLDCIRERIGIIKRVREIFFSILVLFDSLDDAGQLHHYLLHSLQKFIVILVGLVGEPLQNWLVVAVGHNSRDIYIFGQKSMFHFLQLQLQIECLFLEPEHFESLCFAVGTFRLNQFTLMWIDNDLSVECHIIFFQLPWRFSNRRILFAIIPAIKVLFCTFVLTQFNIYVLTLFLFWGSVVVVWVVSSTKSFAFLEYLFVLFVSLHV